jgi:23S rRNA (cytidine1920-2'-O)/16S rRNA (cytidine1409-2'-O)-methyltransferase
MKPGVAGPPWAARCGVLSRARVLEYERGWVGSASVDEFAQRTRPGLALSQDALATAHHPEMGSKKRLDVLLVERGLAESRSQAQALVLAGRVAGHSKAGEQVDEEAELELAEGARFVSRGGDKLAAALTAFGVDVAGEDCLDVGASTGGFSDCLLQAGAARVIALDVGYGQLHPKLRDDPRVTVLERTNVRGIRCEELPFRPTFVVCDVSFVGLAKALPPALACAAPGWRALVLVKPQFEAGPADVGKGGVVRDPEVHRRVVDEVLAQAPEWGARVLGVEPSALLGPKGNREFFVHLADASVEP